MTTRRNTNRSRYAIAGVVIIAAGLIFAYHRHNLQVERSRHALRPLQQDASSVVDSQMLQGNFGNSLSTQDRQAVEAALQASDQPSLAQTQAPQTEMRSGKERIVLTQPLGTTVEDTEPTLTWDAPSDGWTFLVHLEDRDSHQNVAMSPVLDEAIWRVSSPLLRGHTFMWRVDGRAAGKNPAAVAITSKTAQFSVLSDEGERQIQSARAGNPSHLLLGALYAHYQMWREAVLEYRKLVSEAPASPEAIRLLRNAELRSNAQLAGAEPQ